MLPHRSCCVGGLCPSLVITYLLLVQFKWICLKENIWKFKYFVFNYNSIPIQTLARSYLINYTLPRVTNRPRVCTREGLGVQIVQRVWGHGLWHSWHCWANRQQLLHDNNMIMIICINWCALCLPSGQQFEYS